MSSTQSQMTSVKETPKKLSAKEKFAAAQAAKASKKSEEDRVAAEKEAAKVAEKAKHDAKFEKEKKKVAKTMSEATRYSDARRAEFELLTKEQRLSRLAELRQMLKEENKKISIMRMDLNCDPAAVGKDALNYERLMASICILQCMV